MEVLVNQVFRVMLLIICYISANSITQSCTSAPIETGPKAENLVSNRSKKSFGACIMYVDLFLLHSDKRLPSGTIFHRILMNSPGQATLNRENLLCGAIILPV